MRAAPTVPKATRGWDNAKKVNGRKRHIAVDTSGLLLEVLVTPASVQDRDAARPLLLELREFIGSWAMTPLRFRPGIRLPQIAADGGAQTA